MNMPLPRPTLGDAMFALAMTAVFGTWSYTTLHGSPLHGHSAGTEPFSTILLLLACTQLLALALRRTAPTGSGALILALTLLRIPVGLPLMPSDVALPIALYSITTERSSRTSRAALLASLATSGLMAYWYSQPPWYVHLSNTAYLAVIFSSVCVASWALGVVSRTKLERLWELEEKAARLTRERDQQAQLATASERARIAREIHDIIAHSLSVMIAQADGGRYAAQTDPTAGTRALETIAEVGRASLSDMRRLLGVLRETTSADAPTQPQPMDDDLDRLVESVRDTGLPVSLVRIGTPRALPPGCGATVYRIVQEALTNAMKHAGPKAKVTVLVQWLRSALALEITDDGRGAAARSDGKGQGTLGMRERAAIFGGTVQAGPRAGGGYQVKALIPTPGSFAEHQLSAPAAPPASPAPDTTQATGERADSASCAVAEPEHPTRREATP